MRIEFKGTTNKDYMMVNTAKFRLKTGSVITIDRDETEFTIEDGKIDMVWRGVYLRAVDDFNIVDSDAYIKDAEEFAKLVIDGKLELELEDDADEDYWVNIENIAID